jgi:hypothetical protein
LINHEEHEEQEKMEWDNARVSGFQVMAPFHGGMLSVNDVFFRS